MAKMNTLMALICAITTAVSGQTRKCTDIMTCGTGLADGTSDMTTMCRKFVEAKTCLMEAIADCKATNAMPADALQGIETQFATSMAHLDNVCKPAEASNEASGNAQGGTTPTCLTLQDCAPDATELAEASKNMDIAKSCRLMHEAGECQKIALADCRERQIMSEKDLQEAENSIQQGLSQTATMCAAYVNTGSGSSGAAGTGANGGGDPMDMDVPPACRGVITCIDREAFMAAQQNQDIETLCKLFEVGMPCLQKALRDCRASGAMTNEQLAQVEATISFPFSQVQEACAGQPVSGTGDVTKMSAGSESGYNQDGQPLNHNGKVFPENATCEELPKCTPHMTIFNKHIKNNRVKEACGLLIPSVDCTRVALAACEKIKEAPAMMLAGAKKNLEKSVKTLEKFCPKDEEMAKENGSTNNREVVVTYAGNDGSLKNNTGTGMATNEGQAGENDNNDNDGAGSLHFSWFIIASSVMLSLRVAFTSGSATTA